jgi:hypothetical protein
MKLNWSTVLSAAVGAVIAYLLIEIAIRPLMAKVMPENFEA